MRTWRSQLLVLVSTAVPAAAVSNTTTKKKKELKKTSSQLFYEQGNSNMNALDLFYKNSRRFAYSFQNYVFMTRVKEIEKVINELKAANALESTLIVVEQSWVTDSETFLALLRRTARWQNPKATASLA